MIKFDSKSSPFFAMSLLEKYTQFDKKLALEFEFTSHNDCNQWVHLLLVKKSGNHNSSSCS